MAKICIDSGHYGNYNRCPKIPEYYESNIVWKLHLLEKKYLEQFGVDVVTTRDNKDVDLGLVERGKASKGCDIFMSDHTNAVGSNNMNEDVDYVVVYYLTDDNTAVCDDISKLFAKGLADVIAETMGVKQGGRAVARPATFDRNGDGILNDNYYGVLHGARLVHTPAVIAEHSFHTNTRMVKWLMNDSNLDKLAKAKAKYIASFIFGTDDKKVFYRVQVGAYTKKQNAENMVAKLKEAGFNGFIDTNDDYYRVQVGAYTYKTNADKTVDRLRKAGFESFIKTVYL